MFIYAIVNRETLKIYIGQHKGLDLGKYLSRKFWDANYHTSGKRSHIYASMRKRPRETWSIHPLISDLQTPEECDYWEKVLIKALNTQNPVVGYNCTDGGRGVTGWKQRARLQDRWIDPAFRQKMSEIQKKTENSGRFKKGHKPSPLSGAKGPNKTSFVGGNNPWNTGTKGIKKANSGSFQKGHHLNQGRVFSQAHREALSRSHTKTRLCNQ